MRPIGDVPHARLYHILDERSTYWVVGSTTTTRYVSYPIAVTRPEHGEAPRTVECGCGAQVELVICAIDRTRARIARWRTLALVGVALVVAAILGIAFPLNGTTQGPGQTFLLVAVVAAAVGGFLVTTLAAIFWRQEDGVRFPLRSQRRARFHLVRRTPPTPA